MTDETPWVDRPTRRTFIKRAGGTAAALSIPGLLAACGSTTPVGPSSAPSSERAPAPRAPPRPPPAPAACPSRGPTRR